MKQSPAPAKPEGKQKFVPKEPGGLKGVTPTSLLGGVSEDPPGLTKAEVEHLGKRERTALRAGQARSEKIGYKLGQREAIEDARRTIDKLIVDFKTKAKAAKDLQNELYKSVKAGSMSVAKQKSILGVLRNINSSRTPEANAKILGKALSRAQEYVEAESKRVLKRQILSELKKTKIKKKRGIPKGKLTADIQREIEKTRANLGGNHDIARMQIANNIQAYHEGKLTQEELLSKNRILNLSGLKGMTSQELSYVLDEIKSLKETGKYIRQQIETQRADRLNEIRGRIYQIITNGKGLKEGTLSLPSDLLEKKVRKLEKLINWNYGLDNLLDKLSKYDKTSKPYESDINKFGDIVHESERNEIAGFEKWLNELNENLTEIFGEGKSVKALQNMSEKRDIGVFTNLDGEKINLKLTGGQLIKKYQELQDPTLNATFTGGVTEEGNRWGMRWTDEIKETVINSLTPKEKQWADSQMSFYQKYYPSVNKVFAEEYGVNLPHNPNYSPIGRDIDSPYIEDVAVMQEAARYAATTNKSLISRVGSKIPLKYNDANKVIVNHIIRMEHFRHWTRSIKELRSVFLDKKIRKAIRQYHGQDVLKHVDLLINQMAKGGIDQMLVHNFLDGMRKNFTTAVLGVKPIIALKQIPSVIAYTTEMPFIDFVGGVADF